MIIEVDASDLAILQDALEERAIQHEYDDSPAQARYCRTLATSLLDEPDVDLFDIELSDEGGYLYQVQASNREMAFDNYRYRVYGGGNVPFTVRVTNTATNDYAEF